MPSAFSQNLVLHDGRATFRPELLEQVDPKCGTLEPDELKTIVAQAGAGKFIPRKGGENRLSIKNKLSIDNSYLARMAARIARPERHGKFFVLDSSYLEEIERKEGCELRREECDIYNEFLRDHPNGGERTAGLVAVRLSDEQIHKLRGRLRITSYRWDLMLGVGEGGKESVIPGNYFDFLDHVRKHKLIIWMDWMANVGVNVPVPETIGYMGLLYAECVVLGDWMLNLDKLGTALGRAWIFQEMSFGALDEAAMGGLFEELRARGKALCHTPEDPSLIKAYVFGCAWVAYLLTRRAFGAVVQWCMWSTGRCGGWWGPIPQDWGGLLRRGVHRGHHSAAIAKAREELPGVDMETFLRLMNLCWPEPVYGWDCEWEVHRPELLSLVCAAPYASPMWESVAPLLSYRDSLDALLQQGFARGLLGAALGCQVTYESDRTEAATAVLRAVARKRFGVELSAEEVVSRAWACVLPANSSGGTFDDFKPFSAGKVHALIVAGGSSVALAPLRLRGAKVTIVENTEDKLTFSYTAADGSVVTFDGGGKLGVDDAVSTAGLRGVVMTDMRKGRPAVPLPKLQDAEGREADIWLCVPEAEPFATAAKGLVFILFTQTRDETVAMTPSEAAPVKGERVISLSVSSSRCRSEGHLDGRLDLQTKLPRADLRF